MNEMVTIEGSQGFQETEPCIYCISTSERTTREHVMPRALGMFEQNWTLDCVCDDCNQFFSRELELVLARDSAEAFFRIDSGIKPPTAARKLLNRRMKGILNVDGLFEGARVDVKPTEEEDAVFPVPPPQVGFRQPGSPGASDRPSPSMFARRSP